MVSPSRRWRFAGLAAVLIIIVFYFSGPHADFVSSPDSIPPPPLPQSWVKLKESFPVTSLFPLPTGKPAAIPIIQAKAPVNTDAATEEERLHRLEAVKACFVHSWTGYKDHAWLRDEVMPVSGGYRDTFGGWAATLVDALDTLWIVGLKGDFEMAVNALQEIDFTTTQTEYINVFETTIRYMGGFLAAYDISGAKYPILLEKAVEVGELLMSVFDTPNRMPITRWNWRVYASGAEQEAPESVIVSEMGSLSLEFTRLAQLTGNDKYYDAVQRVSDEFHKAQNLTKLPGMWPMIVNAAMPDFSRDTHFHLGGMSDSLYEYLPKQYMMLGGLLRQPAEMYDNFMRVAKKYMFIRVKNVKNQKILVSAEMQSNGGGSVHVDAKGQHLTCFAGGMVAIGSKIFNKPEELEIGAQLTDGCIWAYDSQVTGVAPEIYSVIKCETDDDCKWDDEAWETKNSKNNLPKGFPSISDKRYILRPEAIESVFIMYRVTGDKKWQDAAWRMFTAIDKVTRTFIANSAINDVTSNKPVLMDSMESFWLAETLKYFYLIFSDMDLVSLDEYVLNTEAHPLKRPT